MIGFEKIESMPTGRSGGSWNRDAMGTDLAKFPRDTPISIEIQDIVAEYYEGDKTEFRQLVPNIKRILEEVAEKSALDVEIATSQKNGKIYVKVKA